MAQCIVMFLHLWLNVSESWLNVGPRCWYLRLRCQRRCGDNHCQCAECLGRLLESRLEGPPFPKDHVSFLFAGNEGWWIYIVPLRKVHAPIESGENNPGCVGFRFIIDSTIRDHRVSRCWKYDTTSSGSDGYAENPLHSKILARLVKYDRNFDQISTSKKIPSDPSNIHQIPQVQLWKGFPS